MTDVIVTSKDIVVEVQQPIVPPTAPPPKIGLVEINQVVTRGSMWMTGSGPPTEQGGQTGDMYLDIDTGDVYRWNGDDWIFEGTFAPSTLTPEEILAALITVDGAGSNLDADLLDGQHGAYYATKAGLDANDAHDVIQDSQIQANADGITANTIAIDNLSLTITEETTPAEILAKIKTVDGPGSGLDADTLDGHDSTYFATQAAMTAETAARTAADTALDGRITTEKNRNDAQDTAIALRLTDAPSDANAYGRKAAAWVDVTEEAPIDGLGYSRKNGAWAPSSGGAHTDDLPPPGPLQDGQFWWKSSTGVLYLWYDDGNSQQWVMTSASPQIIDQNYSRKTASRKNLLINGALNISQQNGSVEGTTDNYFAADNFWDALVASGAACGFGRVAALNPSGSQFRLRLRVTTAKVSLGAGDLICVFSAIEGLNIQDLGWNTATPKDAVLTFGFNGPAGTYAVSVRNFNGSVTTHSFIASFTISAAQALTDTVQVIKVPAPPGSMTTWATDNSAGIYLVITLACGATYSAPAAGWNSGVFNGLVGMSNGIAAVQTFQFWDFGLYPDPDKTGLAPAFEIPNYADDLARCMRYYERTYRYVEQVYTIATAGSLTSRLWAVPKRTAPTTGFIYNNNLNTGVPTISGINALGFAMQSIKDAANGLAYYAVELAVNARM
jgi:hypothetical protein